MSQLTVVRTSLAWPTIRHTKHVHERAALASSWPSLAIFFSTYGRRDYSWPTSIPDGCSSANFIPTCTWKQLLRDETLLRDDRYPAALVLSHPSPCMRYACSRLDSLSLVPRLPANCESLGSKVEFLDSNTFPWSEFVHTNQITERSAAQVEINIAHIPVEVFTCTYRRHMYHGCRTCGL